MNATEVVVAAISRTIVVGEDHWKKSCRRKILALMRAAHEAGYRTLGVEVSASGSTLTHPYSGLDEMVTLLKRLGKRRLKDEKGRARLMNMHWYVQEALRLKWEIVALDEHHWDWRKNKYFKRRNPALARAIDSGDQMIAQVGNAHLWGLYKRIEKEVYFLNSFRIPKKNLKEYKKLWGRKKAQFTYKVPYLSN
jgi:hypothetical protein